MAMIVLVTLRLISFTLLWLVLHLLPCFGLNVVPLSERLAGSRPNIVLIMADDMGWGDLGANWPNTRDTPFLDYLASMSIRLPDYHSGASVCSVSRAALLTGRLPRRTGVWQNFAATALGGLPTNETIIPEFLKSVGYTTAIHGKWHLGHQPPFHPSYRGFDEYIGVPFSVDMGCTDNPGANYPPVKVCPKDPPLGFEQKHEHPDDIRKVIEADLTVGIPLYQCLTPRCLNDNCNKEIIEQPVNLSTLTQSYIDNDRRFIQSSVEANKPFFLYLPLSHMHVPHDYAQRFKNTSVLPSIYGDTLRELDYHVNQTYQVLNNLNVLNQTLLIFTSDNGPWLSKCDLGGSPGPFTGVWQASPLPFGGGGGSTAKLTTWEAGHRVPFIAHWPGFIKPNTVSNAIGSNLDMMPTIANLAGFTLPSNLSFDGIDLGPVLFDGSNQGHETLFHSDQNGTLSAVRYNQYKAYYTTYSAIDGTCGGQRGLIIDHKPPLFFDLSHDLAESTPIVVSQSVYNAIDQALQAKLKDIASTPHTQVDYRAGGLDARACCDAGHIVCRCTD
jgi:arylsulfatase G